MSYDKQNWQTGDVITANKLNHIEDGIANGGGVLVVSAVYDEQTDTTTLDKTWQEIHDATFAVIITENPMGKIHDYISIVGQIPDGYFVTSGIMSDNAVQSNLYKCNSADGYPVLQSE